MVTSKTPYESRLYVDIKKDASNYLKAKKSAVENFLSSGNGNWIGKPVEQDMFGI